MTRALACEASLPPMLREPSFLCAPVGDLDRLGPGIVALAGLFLDHGDQTAFGRRFAARQLRYACALDRIRSRAACVDLGDLNVFPLEPARQERLPRAFVRADSDCAARGLHRIATGA